MHRAAQTRTAETPKEARCAVAHGARSAPADSTKIQVPTARSAAAARPRDHARGKALARCNPGHRDDAFAIQEARDGKVGCWLEKVSDEQ